MTGGSMPGLIPHGIEMPRHILREEAFAISYALTQGCIAFKVKTDT